ncbi:MAG: Rrf2 family transcriptional regulator [Chamaesiphon sp.]
MELFCKSEYTLLALLELATCYHTGEPLQIRQIAALHDIPDRYLEQLLATLRRGGLIKSMRGAKGGYVLAREPWKITLLDALNCVEGLDTAASVKDINTKTLESKIVQEIWQEANQASNSVLQKYTLQDLCERRIARRQIELMYYI